MTRKDYILIARGLRKAYSRRFENWMRAAENQLTVEAIALYLADLLREDNPRFDSKHFLAVVKGEKDLTSRPPRK